MSGGAFAVTHHAFSSGAGRTSDGNGSHWSTSKTPSYTKSVSWQHHPVRRWVRECRIFPPPVKDGREYLFHESAVKVDLNRPVTGSLLKRIRNGKKEKP
nr:excisionase [Escherichia coli]